MPLSFLSERDLARLAKRFRRQAGKTRAQAARDMSVKQTAIFHAEETPSRSLAKLRVRMIEVYSGKRVRGPAYFLGNK